jgi:ATP-dependent DNA ligase
MSLPIPRTYRPMEALLVDDLPAGPEWQYEPKWDGFRCLAFRDGDRIELMSKAGKPLTRYFPEVVETLREVDARRFVLDGELVVPVGKGFSFDELLQRIHPAASRIAKLSAECPATLIVFDLLVDPAGRALTGKHLGERRAALEAFMADRVDAAAAIRLSPSGTGAAAVRKWLARVGGGLDGIIAKRLDLPYQSGTRTGMQKMKLMRTADCVVGGYRYASRGAVVGSLLLGLYDEEGLLHHVGFTANIPAAEKKPLTARLEKLKRPPGFTGRAPGGPSRWSTERSAEWEPLAPRLVVEVRYDHFDSGRFRHGTSLVRWRPDKKPAQCTMDQVAAARHQAVGLLGRGGKRSRARAQ